MIRVNGVEQSHVEETVDRLLTRLSIESRGVAVALDGDVVRRSEWTTTQILDGCSVEVVTAAAGG